MLNTIRKNKILFFAFILMWFIIGGVIFNHSTAVAQNHFNQQDFITYFRLYVNAFNQVRMNYVEEVSDRDLIENSINGMYNHLVKVDSTFVRTDDYKDKIEIISQMNMNIRQEIENYLNVFQEELMKILAYPNHEETLQEFVFVAIEGMLDDLDPNTAFLRPDAFRRLTDMTQGGFGGLGISIDRQGDYVIVVSPIEGTPAYRMGIQAGDKIAQVDGESVVGMITDDVISRMRGEPGSRVIIGIERPGVEDMLEFEIIREIIRLTSVPYAFVLDNGVGYIRIREFNANTTNELRVAIDKLEAEDIEGLIIDLRGNTGGLLNEAVDTINEFIGRDKLVVFTRGRARGTNREYNTTYNRQRADYPVVTMINQASASASEIFSGSMQDWDRGLVVGMPSFGKGSVQSVIPLSENYGMRVTISKYYIKSGRSIHKDSIDRLLRSGEEITEEDLDEINKSIDREIYYTVNGREVFGGGGIVPDIQMEGTYLTPFEINIRRLNLFFDFSMLYFQDNMNNIEHDFWPNEEMINDFLALGESKGLEYTEEELENSLEFIEISLASNIIARKFGEQEGYIVGLRLDSQLDQTKKLFDYYKTTEEMFFHAAANE